MSHPMLKAAVVALFVSFLIVGGFASVSLAADVAELGGTALKGTEANTLKGRVYAQWADNPDGEILFGVQYWNTGEPASGMPSGRVSSDLSVQIPDPLFVCCAWGFTGGTENNNPYAGHYSPGTTVRLKVKDKALMDQIIKASQNLVAMEVTLTGGNTITAFKVLEPEF